MVRKSMIALATLVSLGAASLAPAAAAGWSPAGPAASQSRPVTVADSRHDSRGHHRGHQVRTHDRRGRSHQVCRVVNVRTVQWTRHGKVVRMVPKTECRSAGARWH